jgi:hypothetical protein
MANKITTIAKLKQLFIEIFLNKTDKVSDVSDDSVLNATAYGVAKVAQKALKDIAIVTSRIFPDTATGADLDAAAAMLGVSARKGALGSSTYVRVIADEGAEYLQGTHIFVNNNGIRFETESNFTMGAQGYDYIKVRSIDSGEKTNVDFASIVSVTPKPVGHIKVTNEYKAIGGRDNEDDETYRIRIKNNLNILSISTLEYLTQVFQNIDDRVLRAINLGTNELGQRGLSIVTQNGVDLLESELEDLLDASKDFFPITDKNRFGDLIGISLTNSEWYYVGGNEGIDFRLSINDNFTYDDVRKDIQVNLSKYLDFRYWDINKKVEWDELLTIVKQTRGVKYVPDTVFKPNVDEIVPTNKLPRIKAFKMRDLNGNIIYDSNNILTPVFYPAN